MHTVSSLSDGASEVLHASQELCSGPDTMGRHFCRLIYDPIASANAVTESPLSSRVIGTHTARRSRRPFSVVASTEAVSSSIRRVNHPLIVSE